MSTSLKRNVGTADVTIRWGLGIALAVSGLLIVKGTIGVVLVLLSALLLSTAITRFCQGHVPFGITATRDGINHGPGDMGETCGTVSAGIETLWLMPRGESVEGYGRHAKRA